MDEVYKTVRGQYFSLTSKPLVNKFIALKQADPNRDVKILLNEGIFLESGLAQKLAQEMMDAGIQVKLYKDEKGKLGTLHAATTMFDKNEATIGSANTTFGGLFSNREADVNVVSQETLAPVDTQFDYDWEHNCREITPEDMKLAAKADEKDESARPYYDTPLENIAKVFGLDLKKMQNAMDRIYDTLGYSDFKPNQELEIRLAVQKLGSMCYQDNKEFDKTVNRYIKLLEAEVKDLETPQDKESKKANKLVKDAREALGNYIVINNIAMNDPKADRETLTDEFVKLFAEMDDPNGKVDTTMDVRSKFAERFGI